MDDKIIPGSRYGDVRKQAQAEGAHGLSGAQIEQMAARMDAMLPKLTREMSPRVAFEDALPEGASWSPQRTGQSIWGPQSGNFSRGPNGSGGNTMVTQQRPYQPEFECCRYGTHIVLHDGSSKEIQDVVVGDRVIDKTGHIQTVERAWCSGIPDELVEIKLCGGETIYTTKNHNWPAWAWVRECVCGCGEPVAPGKCYAEGDAKGGFSHFNNKRVELEKVDGGAKSYRQRRIPVGYNPLQKLTAEQLHVGDFLMIPRSFDAIETKVDPDLARLLGYYIAEGYTGPWGLAFCLGLHERNTLATDIHDLLQRYADVEGSIDEKPERSACIVRSGTKKAIQFGYYLIQHGGKYALHKRLSAEVMHWPVKQKLELLRGMFYGDGSQFWTQTNSPSQTAKDKTKLYKSNKFAVTYTTISRTLAYQTQLLLAQVGVYARITKIRDHEKTYVDKHGELVTTQCKKCYRLVAYGQHAVRLADLLWGAKSKSQEYKQKRQREAYRVDDDNIYIPISSVKTVSNDKPVFNLSVSGDHSYLIDNIGTYNSQDRQQFPVHRILANRYWRLFYKLDPVIGNALDMYGEMPWSDFQLSGDGIDGEVRDGYERMCELTKLLTILPYLIKEYLVIGEVVPHCFYDDIEGLWTYIALHNPDQLEVVDAPFIKMDPIVEFIPDDRLRTILTSERPALQRIRDSMPPELLSRLYARQNVPLSPLNATFIARKLHPYDVRGTSIITRMWRVLMYEDAIFNASISTARRSAAPLKVAKLGNAATGWLPGPEHEARLLQLLAQAELDPQCFVPSTPVTLGNGTRKTIGSLSVGDVVLDMHGKPTEVLALQTEKAQETVRIKCVGMDEVECTTTHKWPVMYKRRRKGPKVNGVREWIHEYNLQSALTADQIRRGDYLLIPRKFKEKRPNITPEQARLLGYYVSEGNMRLVYTRDDGSKRWGFELSLCSDEMNTIRQDVDDILGKLCGTEANLYHGDKNNLQVRVNKNASSDLAEWLKKHGGEYAQHKQLSAEVMQWPLDLKYEFLKGYIAGDGCSIHRKKTPGIRYIEVGSASLSLIHQVQLICAQLGTLAKINHRVQAEDSYGPGNLFHRLHIHGEWAAKISREVFGFDARAPQHNTQLWFTDDNFLYTKINGITQIEHPTDVINMTVSGDHTYLANSLATRNSWLVYNYGIAFELIGNNDRLMSINTHWDMIERVKLIAMGISKSFVHGEVSYASASTGLQVFLTRLKALRTFFEQVWIYPKFFRPIAEMNGWTRSTPAEISHHFRVKRSQREMVEQNRYILPKIVWDKTLDPQVNANLINAMQVLEGLGCKFSKTTKMATIGSNYEAEQKKIKFEEDFERQFLPKKKEQAPDENKPAGGGSVSEDAPPPSPSGDGETGDGGAPPPAPGAAPGDPAAAPAAASAGEGEENKFEDVEEEPTPTEANSSVLKSKIWTDDKFGNWAASEAEGIVELFREGETESAFWDQLVKKHSDGQQTSFMRALYHREYDQALNVMDDFLEDQGYPEADVQDLHHILEVEGCVGHPESSRLVELEKLLPDDTDGLDDTTFDTLVATTYSKAKVKLPTTPDKVIPATEKKAKKIKKMSNSEFLVGGGSLPMDASGGLNGDISGLLPKR